MSVPSGLAGVLVSSTPIFVALSARLGRRAVIMGGALFGLLFAFPLFWMLDTGDMFLVWLAFPWASPSVSTPCLRRRALTSPSSSIRAPATAVSSPLARCQVAAALLAWTAGDPWSISAYLALL